MALLYKITETCDSCGVCASSCPLDVIASAGETFEIGIGCNLCGVCAGICPRGAIRKL